MASQDRMITAWTSHLKTKDEKEAFEKLLRNNLSKQFLSRFDTILNNSLVQVDRREQSIEQYETASWSHKQAHLNGYRQAIQMVNDLFAAFK